MRRLKLISLWGTMILLGCSGGAVKPTPAAAPPSAPPVEAAKIGYQLHPYVSETWSNGLQTVFIEDHTLPSISLGIFVKDGSASDPMAKSGLMQLTAKTMLRGTRTLSASQVADALGRLGSDFESEVSEDFAWFEVDGLSLHSKKLLDIFSDVMLHPQFDLKEIEREKGIALAGIKGRPDHPDAFALEAFTAYLYGGHPYARPVIGLETDVKSMSRKDLLAAYERTVRPNNAILVVTGDFSPDFRSSLKKIFGSWRTNNAAPKVFPEPPHFSGINIRVVNKPDLTQSQIIMGHLGIKRESPDFLKLRVANTILGGSFTSRLMDQVRVNLGLTYGISSTFDPRLDRGPFFISTFTKNQSVGAAVNESLKVFKKFYDDGVSSSEVLAAKNFLMGAFPRAVETPERLGFNLALLRLYGLSDDYLKNFVANVQAITPEDVNVVIKEHFNVKDLKILVLTKSEETLDQLRPLGLVEVRKFSEVF